MSFQVKNFVLFGDIHKSIYFLCWKEDGAQLTLLAKDFGALDCYTTEFLIDGSTLSLLVSDSHKNLQIFSYAPKSVESWKGQKLLPRAEFHLGAHVAKFLRLQMLPTASTARSNRFAVLFGTLDGAIDYLAPVDELTFRRLQTLQRKLVDSVAHVAGLNPRAFRQFRCDGKAHRPGPDNIVDCELLSQ
jgi:cleavage and polyadenylation specificity factor subunit 1